MRNPNGMSIEEKDFMADELLEREEALRRRKEGGWLTEPDAIAIYSVLEAFKERHKLKARVQMLEHEQAGLATALCTEFTSGEPSGDLLQDYAMFFEHHWSVEKELRETNQLLVEKNETTNVFMRQVKKLQAELHELKLVALK